MLWLRANVLAATLVISVSATTGASAASPEPGDKTYHTLRYNDDFTYLADPSKASDPWDPLKYIRLGDGQYGASYLSFGGELRERTESYINPNFGLHAPRANAYLLHRLLLNTDVEVTDYVRAFLQVGNMERLGDRGLSSTTDIDHFDLMQGFVDIKPPSPLGDAPVLRAGREELLFGFQRLIAVREGPNVRRDFDGLRFSDHIGGATIDLITVHPVNDNQNVLDDHTNQNQGLWGGYLTVPVGSVLKTDVYWLNYENKAARYRGVTGVERRQTFGIRLFGETEGFDWNGEVALQSGRFGNRDIRADMFAGIGGYTFSDVAWQPRIGLEANFASGDSGRGTAIGTFNAMYPRLPYFAETSLLVPANVYDIRPVLSFRPQPAVFVTLGWDNLWRASTSDGLYGSGMTLYANTNKVNGQRIGSEFSADVRWRLDQHLLLGAIAAEFVSGPAVQQAFGKSVAFFVLFATYRF